MLRYLVFYRSKNQIKTLLTDLRDKIREIENQFGCVDELRKLLKEKEQKYGVDIEFTAQLKQSCEVSKLYNFYEPFVILLEEILQYIPILCRNT